MENDTELGNQVVSSLGSIENKDFGTVSYKQLFMKSWYNSKNLVNIEDFCFKCFGMLKIGGTETVLIGYLLLKSHI